MKSESPSPPNQPMVVINAWKRPKCQMSRKKCRPVRAGRPAPTAVATAKASAPNATEVAKSKRSSTATPQDSLASANCLAQDRFLGCAGRLTCIQFCGAGFPACQFSSLINGRLESLPRSQHRLSPTEDLNGCEGSPHAPCAISSSNQSHSINFRPDASTPRSRDRATRKCSLLKSPICVNYRNSRCDFN